MAARSKTGNLASESDSGIKAMLSENEDSNGASGGFYDDSEESNDESSAGENNDVSEAGDSEAFSEEADDEEENGGGGGVSAKSCEDVAAGGKSFDEGSKNVANGVAGSNDGASSGKSDEASGSNEEGESGGKSANGAPHAGVTKTPEMNKKPTGTGMQRQSSGGRNGKFGGSRSGGKKVSPNKLRDEYRLGTATGWDLQAVPHPVPSLPWGNAHLKEEDKCYAIRKDWMKGERVNGTWVWHVHFPPPNQYSKEHDVKNEIIVFPNKLNKILLDQKKVPDDSWPLLELARAPSFYLGKYMPMPIAYSR